MYRLTLVILSVASAFLRVRSDSYKPTWLPTYPDWHNSPTPTWSMPGVWRPAALPRYGSEPTVADYRCCTTAPASSKGLIVTMAGDKSVTGVAFSNVAGSFNGDTFLFANEDGTIGGWRGALGTAAETLQIASAANVYKGLSDATIGGNCVRIRRELPQRLDRRTERKRRSAEPDRELYGPQSAFGICAIQRGESGWCFVCNICRSGRRQEGRCGRCGQRHRGRVSICRATCCAGWPPTAS